ncbi:TPA: GNAT family N-acetyltransferase [Streptococcus suis]
MKLIAITEQNIYDLMALQVKPEQKYFVRDAQYTLAECYLYPEDETVLLFALEEQGEVVGFVALLTEIDNKSVAIWRMMIGQQYQGQGYGRKALQEIETYVRTMAVYDKIVADYVMENEEMKHLLETEGYVVTGKQEEWNEVIMTKLLS